MSSVSDNAKQDTPIHTNEESPRLIALTTSDVATINIQSNPLSARDREVELVKSFQERIKEKKVPFFEHLKKDIWYFVESYIEM